MFDLKTAILPSVLTLSLATGLCSASAACKANGECSIDVFRSIETGMAWGYLESAGCPTMFHTVKKVAKDEFHYRSTFILDSEQCVIENWQFKSVMWCGEKDSDPLERTYIDMPPERIVNCPDKCKQECEALPKDWVDSVYAYKFTWTDTQTAKVKRHPHGQSRLLNH